MLLKVGENVIRVSNSLDLDETSNNSGSIVGTIVMIGGLWVKYFFFPKANIKACSNLMNPHTVGFD